MLCCLFLLVASYIFYAALAWQFVWLLFLCTIVSFVCGILLEKTAYKKTILSIAIIFFLGILAYLKYRNFFAGTLNTLGAHLSILPLILPLGISFYIFEAIGYLIDVKRKVVPASKNFLEFALFIAFFPKVILGPIERAAHLLPQIRLSTRVTWDTVESSFLLFIWGAFKKIVIADQMGVVLLHHNAPLFMAYLYAFQLYFDFSGYTDMAIGAARLFGISLLPNFQRPYASLSISEFWRRWHMSFSFWLRDYLYIPLGGNRVSPFRRYINIMIVFLLSGLWHGAGWTFVLWGCLHGFFVIFGIVTTHLRTMLVRITGLLRAPRLHHFLQIVITFHMVAFAWILFYSRSVGSALQSYRHLFDPWDISIVLLLFLVIVIACVEGVEWLRDKIQLVRLRWPAFYCLLLAVILFGRFESSFIYVRF